MNCKEHREALNVNAFGAFCFGQPAAPVSSWPVARRRSPLRARGGRLIRTYGKSTEDAVPSYGLCTSCRRAWLLRKAQGRSNRMGFGKVVWQSPRARLRIQVDSDPGADSAPRQWSVPRMFAAEPRDAGRTRRPHPPQSRWRKRRRREPTVTLRAVSQGKDGAGEAQARGAVAPAGLPNI